MKNACAKRAKILFFFVKYANLLGSCCRRRRGCLSSLTIIFQELLFISYQDEAIAKNATNGSFWCSLLHDYSLLTIPPTCFRRLTLEIVTNRVSSSQSLSGGLLDLTKESNNWNKINWTILPENIRLCYQIPDHLCLNEQLKNIETWLPKKKRHSRLFTPRFMDTSSFGWPRINQETSIALLTASCLTLVSFESSKEEITYRNSGMLCWPNY